MSDQNTNDVFDIQLVRSNMAWVSSTLMFMTRKHKVEANEVLNLLIAARGVKAEFVYDVYQYVSPLFDKLVKAVRLEESCRYSSAYQKKREEAMVALWAAVNSLEQEPGQLTLKRLQTVCAAR